MTNDSIDASKGNCPQAPYAINRKRKIEIWPACSVASCYIIHLELSKKNSTCLHYLAIFPFSLKTF